VSFPIIVPVVTIEIKRIVLSDTAPTPASGYEIVLVKDLTYTKLWMEFKVTGI
jgi:hypothetical protein